MNKCLFSDSVVLSIREVLAKTYFNRELSIQKNSPEGWKTAEDLAFSALPCIRKKKQRRIFGRLWRPNQFLGICLLTQSLFFSLLHLFLLTKTNIGYLVVISRGFIRILSNFQFKVFE